MAHLIQLYADGASSVQITTLFARERNGATLHQLLVGAHAGAADLIAAYAVPRSTADLQALIGTGRIANGADLRSMASSNRRTADIVTISNNAAAATPAQAIGPIGIAATNVQQVAAGAANVAALLPNYWGLTLPEDVVVNLTANLVGGRWYAAVTNVTGRYSKQLRLLPGVTEVTGPGGNSTPWNYAHQVTDLRAGTPRHGAWFMLRAVDEHESIHAQRMLPALQAVEPIIQGFFAGLSVPATAAVNSAPAAIAALQLAPGYQATRQQAYARWRQSYMNLIAHDHGAAHNGPAYVAEQAITTPMINAINTFAWYYGWGYPA